MPTPVNANRFNDRGQELAELLVPVADRTLPLSVVGRLYTSIRESLDAQTSRDATALWNAIIRADKASKGIAVERYTGPVISAERLDALLAADRQQAAA